MNLTVQSNLGDLNKVFEEYWKLSKLSREEALRKHAGNFALDLYRSLKEIAPAKGAITTERRAALKQGVGLIINARAKALVYTRFNVSQTIRGRHYQLNKIAGRSQKQRVKEHARLMGLARKFYAQQVALTGRGTMSGATAMTLQTLLVDQELRLRESAPGFLAISARYPRMIPKDAEVTAVDKYNRALSKGTQESRGEEDAYSFNWNSGVGKMSGILAHAMNKPKSIACVSRAIAVRKQDLLNHLAGQHAKIASASARNIRKLGSSGHVGSFA